MHVILYMAMTANGYIAKEDNETPWSDEGWKSFSEKVKDIKNIVVGRKTFEIMEQEEDFQKIGEPFTVVVSNKKEDDSNFVTSPEQAIKLLEKRGFSETPRCPAAEPGST